MGFELRSHTADIAVEATGETLESVFGAVANGLALAACDDVPADGGDRFPVSVSAENREALLFDYLDELIYQRDVRAVLPVDNRVTDVEGKDSGRLSMTGSARGVPLAELTAREIKAVTYSEMRLEERGDEWYAYVVFDV